LSPKNAALLLFGQISRVMGKVPNQSLEADGYVAAQLQRWALRNIRMRTLLFLLILTALFGCSASHPEDNYKGQVHWVSIVGGDHETFAYDLGSVRRVDQNVILNWKITEDTLGLLNGLSAENTKRKQLGLPALFQTTSVAFMNCHKRTSKFTEVEREFTNGNVTHERDIKEQVIPPNSPFEKVYDALCNK
jgi:hypothetical protein